MVPMVVPTVSVVTMVVPIVSVVPRGGSRGGGGFVGFGRTPLIINCTKK